MSARQVVRFTGGMRAVLEPHGGGFRVCLLHPVEGRGCTTFHSRERAARNAHAALVRSAEAAGWQRAPVRSVASHEPPAKMEFGPGGERRFRDRRTGELFEDTSCSRPLGAAVSVGVPAPWRPEPRKLHPSYAAELEERRLRERDAFDANNLPEPQR